VGRRSDDDEDDDETGEELRAAEAEADAALRFGLGLLLSLVLAAPRLWDAYRGMGTLDGALVHYLLCFGVAQVGLGVLGQLHAGYRRAQARSHAAGAPGAPGAPAKRVPGRLTETR
jgi:hypothetical protein